MKNIYDVFLCLSVKSAHQKTKELFAAFEDKDVQKLHDLITSIQSFDKKKSLRKTITRDDSVPNLSRISISHSIESFDATSLKHVEGKEKRCSLYEEASKEEKDGVFLDISLKSSNSDSCLEERNVDKMKGFLDSEPKNLVEYNDRGSSSSIEDIFDAMNAAISPCRDDISEQNAMSQAEKKEMDAIVE